jgi:alpha-ribazole phosphatase/probable phosphoglycerate mutase
VGRATGWWPGRLSDQGRVLAARLGERRRDDGIAAVFSSDLTRAAETASVAFGTTGIPVLLDWRLRECDYGKRNGMPVAELHANRPENRPSQRVAKKIGLHPEKRTAVHGGRDAIIFAAALDLQ